MVFVAVEGVCEFKKGDRVPDARGKIWFKMYKYPPVKLEELVVEPVPVVKELISEKKPKRSRRSRKKED